MSRGRSDDGRERGRDRGSLALQAGFTCLVAASGVLVSLRAGAGLRVALLAGVVGLFVGAVVTWFVLRNVRRLLPDAPSRRRRRR